MSLQTWQETLISASTDTAAAIIVVGPTSILPTAALVSLPNNFFQVGKVLRLTAHGRLSTSSTTATVRFDVRFNTSTVWDSLAMTVDATNAHTTQPWKLEILLTCRAIGSGTSATLMGVGTFISTSLTAAGTDPRTVPIAALPWNFAPAAPGGTGAVGFDSTLAQSVDVRFTAGGATGLSLTCHQYILESLN